MSRAPDDPGIPQDPPSPDDPQIPASPKKASSPTSHDNEPPSKRSSRHYTTEELERGLTIVGFGRYNLLCTLALALLLISSVMELLGSSAVLPAAKCDLNVTDSERGAISAIPYIGILLTSYIHGYLIDTRGRRKMAIITALGSGSLAFLSAFMPNLVAYAFFKFLASLFIAVPSALPYTYLGEIVPQQYRDMLLSIANALQLIGSALVPLIAWIIIPQNITIIRPWRILTMIYASFLILAGVIMKYAPESPKYLLSRGHPEEALKVLQTIYAGNKQLPREDFPMKTLAGPPPIKNITIVQCLKRQTKPLLKRKYMKYLLLNGFLLFGVFAIFNGVYVWVLDVVNRVISDDEGGKTACDVIMDTVVMDEIEGVCIDIIDTKAFMINSIAQVICAMIGLAVSFTVVQYAGKFYLLLSCYLVIGTICIIINHITNGTAFVILISAFPLIALALGPVNAYGVEIFPPHMRGMAVLLCMMVGRVGSVFSATLTGLLLDHHCNELFYMFGVLLYVCAGCMYFHRPKK